MPKKKQKSRSGWRVCVHASLDPPMKCSPKYTNTNLLLRIMIFLFREHVEGGVYLSPTKRESMESRQQQVILEFLADKLDKIQKLIFLNENLQSRSQTNRHQVHQHQQQKNRRILRCKYKIYATLVWYWFVT